MSGVVWNTLGIEPTKDIKKIKHAYASASKKYHPEEHPEEFKRLQKAYKEAMKYAKSEAEVPQEPESVIKSESIPETRSESKSALKPGSKLEPKPEQKPKQETKPEPKFVSPPVPKPEQPQAQPMPSLKVEDKFIPPTQIPKIKSTSATEIPYKVEPPIPEPTDMPSMKTEMFNYEEILSNQEVDLFWRQLDFICWHPYVKKSYDYWNYFLSRPDVLKRMEDADFQNRFKKRLKEENYIWDKYILKYLDDYLNKYVSEDNASSGNWASKHLKPGVIKSFLGRTKKAFDTKNEEQTYQILWYNVKEEVRQNPEVYLKQYFTYAEINYDKLKEIHREADSVRGNRPIIRILIFLFIMAVIVYGVHNEMIEEQVRKMSTDELISQVQSDFTDMTQDKLQEMQTQDDLQETLIQDDVIADVYRYKNDEHFMSLVEEYAPSCIDNEAALMSLYILRDREALLIEELQTLQIMQDKLDGLRE